MLAFYEFLSYNNASKTGIATIVKYTSEVLSKHGLKNINKIQLLEGVYIYPKEYFCPKDYVTGKLKITNNTVAIHHYGASWVPFNERIELRFWQILGLKPHRFMWHLNRLLRLWV